MTDPDFQAIGQHARALAEAADTDLAPDIGRQVSRVAGQETAKLLGQMDIKDESNCGRLTMLFRDHAQPAYGVLSIQFDRQGNILMSEAHDPGSQVALGVTRDMMRGGAGTEIGAGRDVIAQIAPTCKL